MDTKKGIFSNLQKGGEDILKWLCESRAYAIFDLYWNCSIENCSIANIGHFLI